MNADEDLNPNPPQTIEGLEAQYLEDIQEGDVFSLAELQSRHSATQFTFLCITDPYPFFPYPDPTIDEDDRFFIGSVGLRDDNFGTHPVPGGFPLPNPNNFNPENAAPYTLADDNVGDYFVTPIDGNFGEWSITCQAFCRRDIQGSVAEDNASRIRTRTFTINP